MIKIENGTLEISGTVVQLMAEFTICIKKYKEFLRKKLGDERAEEEFNRSVQLAGMSEVELDAAVEETLQSILDNMFRRPKEKKEDTDGVSGMGRKV